MSTPILLTLDREADFGKIWGEHERFPNAQFQQNGFLFDGQGNLIEESVTEEGRAKLAAMVKRQKAQEAARKAYKDALGDDLDEGEIAFGRPTSEVHLEAGVDVDLIAWDRGNKTYFWHDVVRKMREVYGITPPNKNEAKRIIQYERPIAPGSQKAA